MYCEYCKADIAKDAEYVRYVSIDLPFCCVTCVTDYMLDSGKLAVEVNTGEEDTETDE